MLSFFLFLLSTPHITLSHRAVAYVGPTRRPPPRSLRRRDLASTARCCRSTCRERETETCLWILLYRDRRVVPQRQQQQR